MNKLLILPLLIAFNYCIAQNDPTNLLYTKDVTQLRVIADSIVSLTGQPYEFYKLDTSSKKSWQLVRYRLKDDPDTRFVVWFQAFSEGANPDLKRPGTLYYTLYSFEGKFLQLFPFWKLFKPEADAEKITASSSDKIYVIVNGKKSELTLRRDYDQRWLFKQFY